MMHVLHTLPRHALQHEQQGSQSYDRLEHRLVAGRDRVKGDLADPGYAEVGLDDQRSYNFV